MADTVASHTWVLPRPIVNRMLTHAMQSAPEECVGILAGKGRTIQEWHPLPNALHHERQFLADPARHIQIMKELRERGLEMIAIYHSHPGAPAEPSAKDFNESFYPEALYLIISLNTQGRLDMNGFLLQGGQARSQELIICD
ncbi:MAG: M67 family metallopeptidase [Magnetococcales bacterium]|nr:M67 family metallopeptidase [Magnetococcales bacterium]